MSSLGQLCGKPRESRVFLGHLMRRRNALIDSACCRHIGADLRMQCLRDPHEHDRERSCTAWIKAVAVSAKSWASTCSDDLLLCAVLEEAVGANDQATRDQEGAEAHR